MCVNEDEYLVFDWHTSCDDDDDEKQFRIYEIESLN